MREHTEKSISGRVVFVLVFCWLFFWSAGVGADQGSPNQQVNQYYENAQMRFAEGNYRESIILLKNALQKDTGHLPSRVLLGRAYLETGSPRQAELEFQAVLEMGADRLVIDIPLAETYLQLGKYDRLLTEIDPARHTRGDAARLLALRGRAYLKTGSHEQADQAFSEALRLDPKADSAMTGMAMVRLHDGKPGQAKALLDQAVALNPDSAEAWVLKGKVAYQQKRIQEGVSYLTRTLEADPENSQARIMRAAYLNDLGQLELAQQDLDLLHAQPVVEPMANYLQAIVHFRRGNPDQAKKSLALAADTLTALPPGLLEQNPQVRLLAGSVAFIQGKQDVAAKHLRAYLEVDSGHAGARRMMTQILLSQNQPKEARRMLEPLAMRMPDDLMVQLLMGQIYLALKDNNAAIRLFERMAARRPEDVTLQLRMARSLVDARQIQGAIELLERAHQLDDRNTGISIMLALLQLNQGKYDQVVIAARSVIEREPENLQAYNVLGLGYLGAGELADARAAFNSALEIDAGYLPARLNLGRVDVREGFPEKARAHYQALLEVDPGQRETLIAMSELEASQGNLEQAIRWRERLRGHHPEEFESNLKLAELYLNNGQPQQAMEVARALQTRYPEDYSVHMALGIAEMAAGKPEDARLTFQNLSQWFSHDADKLYRIAGYQKQLNDLEAAHSSLSNAVEAAPGWMAATVDLTLLEIRMGMMEAALGRALKLQVLEPRGNEGHFLEGEVHLAENNPVGAERAYLRAWNKKPDSATAVRLYQVRRMDLRPRVALRELEAWGAAHPEDQTVQEMLAAEMIRSGRYADATQRYEQLLARQPDNPGLLNNLAMLYQKTGDPRALETAQKAYRLSPEDPLIADTLGWVLVNSGEPGEGLRYLREARLRKSDLPEIGYHLAAALHALGRDAEARTELEKLLKGGKEFPDRDAAVILLRKLD